MIAGFCAGVAVGALHWWLFLLGVRKLAGASSSGGRLWRVSVAFSWARLLLTWVLLIVLSRAGFSSAWLIGGLLATVYGFRVLAYCRGNLCGNLLIGSQAR